MTSASSLARYVVAAYDRRLVMSELKWGQKEHLWRIEYRIQLHQDALKKAIKKAQEATKQSEGGVYVSIG